MAIEELDYRVLSKPISQGESSATWIIAVPVAAFWMLIIVLIHWNSPRTLVSFHGLLHAAIANQFLGQTGLSFPPENPFYAGEPLPYYWFFHFLAAQITRLTGLNIFYSFEALIVLSTAGLVVSGVFLGRRLFNKSASGLLISFLILTGTNPFGWLFLIRSLFRKGSLILNDNTNHLWGVTHPIYSIIRYNDVGGLYGPLLNFFLNITSRPVALASLLLTLLSLEWQRKSRRIIPFVSTALACALTTALSPVIGIPSVVALTLSFAALWFLNRFVRSTGPSESGSLLPALGALLAGVLLALPTYYHLVIGPSERSMQFYLFSAAGLRHLVTVGLSISVLIVLAALGLYRSRAEGRNFLSLLFGAALILLAADISLLLPAGNASNLFHAAVVMLAVPAAGGLLMNRSHFDSRYRRWLTLGVILLFLPTPILLLASYIHRPVIAAGFSSPIIERSPKDSEFAELYHWVKSATDPRSIFIIDPRDAYAVCGNTAEFPAMTGRAIFTENREHYIAKAYPDARYRFALARNLTSGEAPESDDLSYLARFKRPIYVVNYHSSDTVLNHHLQESYGTPVFLNREISVYALNR